MAVRRKPLSRSSATIRPPARLHGACVRGGRVPPRGRDVPQGHRRQAGRRRSSRGWGSNDGASRGGEDEGWQAGCAAKMRRWTSCRVIPSSGNFSRGSNRLTARVFAFRRMRANFRMKTKE